MYSDQVHKFLILLFLNLLLDTHYNVKSELVNITDGNSTSITDFGKTIMVNSTYINTKTPKSPNTVAEGEELVETTCHIFTEKLVATAKASVSSAFENLCDSGQLISHIDKVEARIKGELNAIKQILLKLETSVIDLESRLTTLSKELGKKYLGSSSTNNLIHY